MSPQMKLYILIFGLLSIWNINTSNKENNIKRLRFSSEEYVAYLELQLEATVFTSKKTYNYEQKHIKSATLYTEFTTGEIKLSHSGHVLGIDFDFTKTDKGYDMTLQWATFGQHDTYRMFKNKEKKRISIPYGSSTIKDLEMKYVKYPQNLENEAISLIITKANIRIENANPIQVRFYVTQDIAIDKELDEFYDDSKTVVVEFKAHKPSGRPVQFRNRILEHKRFE